MNSFEIDWFLEHVHTNQQVPITTSPFRVGRTKNMDLSCESINVSRSHADILTYIDGSLHIKENKSINGTFINKQIIARDQISRVNEGDEIGFGSHSGMVLENIQDLHVYIAKRRVQSNVEHHVFQSNVTGGRQLEISIQPSGIPSISTTCNYIVLPTAQVTETCHAATTSKVYNTNSSEPNEINSDITGTCNSVHLSRVTKSHHPTSAGEHILKSSTPGEAHANSSSNCTELSFALTNSIPTTSNSAVEIITKVGKDGLNLESSSSCNAFPTNDTYNSTSSSSVESIVKLEDEHCNTSSCIELPFSKMIKGVSIAPTSIEHLTKNEINLKSFDVCSAFVTTKMGDNCNSAVPSSKEQITNSSYHSESNLVDHIHESQKVKEIHRNATSNCIKLSSFGTTKVFPSTPGSSIERTIKVNKPSELNLKFSGNYTAVSTENCPTACSSKEQIAELRKPKEENLNILTDVHKRLNIEHNRSVGYSVDDDGCIVLDSDADEVIIKKEPLSNSESIFNDTIFCNVKKELEALDSFDENFMPTYCIDSDGEASQDWNDIFGILDSEKSPSENTEDNTNSVHKIKSVSAQCSVRSNNSTDLILRSKQNKGNEKVFVIPPIIAPHFEKNLEIRNKRKSSTSDTEEFKKIKTENFYNSKSKQNYKNVLVENIHDIRKRKLKEIGERSQHQQSDIKSNKSGTAKVKVSEGRGKFLETPCEPSTSKVRLVTIKPRSKPSNSGNEPLLNSNPPINNITTPCKVILTKHYNNIKNASTVLNDAPLLPVNHINKVARQLNGYKESEHAGLIKDVEDIILQMLAWNVSWFIDRNDNDKVPNLSKHPLRRMNKSFTSYTEYYKIVMPLLMVELWNFLYKEVDFNFTNEHLFHFTVEKETVKKQYFELDCLITLPKDKSFKEGDVIVLQLYIENEKCEVNPHKVAVLGYVIYVNRRDLLARETPSISGNQSTVVTVHARIMVQHLESTLKKSPNVKHFLQHITSFVSSARTIRSIKYLEKSSLRQHILRPSCSLYKVPAAPKAVLYLKNELNKAQLEAVSEATNICLNNKPNIYLIHGPPGTGKTTVIVNIILSVIFDMRFKDRCILVTAPTNAAVDALVLKIISSKTDLQDNHRKMIDMVRVGPKSSIRAEVLDYSLYEGAKRTLWKDLLKHESIENRRKLKERKDTLDLLKHQKDPRWKNASVQFEECCRNILGRRYNERIYEYETILLERARIICTTLSSCASMKMEKVFSRRPGKISCCIIDEATQSTEQETLIPLILGVDKLILVGDPKQLPALSFAQESKSYGFGQSLFSRIDENFKNASYNPIKFLNMQYRMHPAVCLFPNQEFYDGRLKNAPNLFNRKSPLNVLRPYLVFHFQGDTDNTEEYRNNSEILCVILLVEAIVSKIPDSCKFSVGIVTPYNDQKAGIIQYIKKKTFRNNVLITVNTVDSFQGSENDIMIMSCVRYHANNFLSDEQRLNVALTRARFALYIIGSTNLFMSCLKFGKIRKDADRRKLLKNLDIRMPLSALHRMILT